MPFRFRRRGMMIVVSAPSGGGKSSILQAVLRQVEGIQYSISATSRPPRALEVDGRDYRFLPLEEFQRLIEADEFIEYAQVHGHYYGTPRAAVEEALARGMDVAMDLDVQGGLTLKERYPETLLIFVMPPSMDVLEKRLRTRASDSEEAVRLRLANARREIPNWPRYDYAIINETLEGAIQAVEDIIRVERWRASRLALDNE